MKRTLDDKARLLHILQAIDYIDEFLKSRSKEAFYEEPMFRFAVERQLEIIGETANHLSDSVNKLLQKSNGAELSLSATLLHTNISEWTLNYSGTL